MGYHPEEHEAARALRMPGNFLRHRHSNRHVHRRCQQLTASQFAAAGLADIREKVLSGDRLTYEDGVRLFQTPHLGLVGTLANHVRERLHGDRAFFVRNQHINYTNICCKRCRFCSFYARKGGPEPYTLTPEQVSQRVRRFCGAPITEIHIVGGVNPALPFDYYLQILRAAREARPEATIKAFTMIELEAIAASCGRPLPDVIRQLRDAGLGEVPGGGVEVLSERIHTQLFGRKLNPRQWLDTARTVHLAGVKSNASLLYGHVESVEERVEHFVQLRKLQDETGGFLAFIPLAFHAEGTELPEIPPTPGTLDLKMTAVARLMLDNFPHIKTFWVMTGPDVAQAALWYGADDLDGTVMEYEITRDDTGGTRQALTRDRLVALIRQAGREPVERDSFYSPVEAAEGQPC